MYLKTCSMNKGRALLEQTVEPIDAAQLLKRVSKSAALKAEGIKNDNI